MPFQHGRLVEWISDWLRGTDFTPAERMEVSHFGPVTPVVDITPAVRGPFAGQFTVEVTDTTQPGLVLPFFTVPQGELLHIEAFSAVSTAGFTQVVLFRDNEEGQSISFFLFNIPAGSSYQPLVRDRLDAVAGDRVAGIASSQPANGLVSLSVLATVEYTAGSPSGVNARYGPLPLTTG